MKKIFFIIGIIIIAVLLGIFIFNYVQKIDIKDNEVGIFNGKITNEVLIDSFFDNIANRKDSSLIIKNKNDKYLIEYFIGENDKAYNKALEEAENGGELSYVSRGVQPDKLTDTMDEQTKEECRQIYGYYKITKNSEEPILLDSMTNILKRESNKEALEDINKGIVTLFFFQTLCNYRIKL